MTNKIKNTILWILVLFFAVLFALSFLQNNTKDNRKALETALLNPKYEVQNLLIYDNKNALEFYYNQDLNIWTMNYPDNEQNKIPADSELIENFIKELKRVRSVYKVADKISDNNTFGITDLSAFHVIYSNYNADLVFGNHDFSQNFRYFSSVTKENQKVYEVDASIDNYLSSSVNVWADPYLISRQIEKNLKPEDFQSVLCTDFTQPKNKTVLIKNGDSYISTLAELRNGGMADSSLQKKEELYKIKIECGNQDTVLLEIFNSSQEDIYLVRENYSINLTDKNYSYETKISGWTLQKLTAF